MSDQYAWWRNALGMMNGAAELTRDQMNDLIVSDGDVHSGFFRTRAVKDGPFLPVAIWRDENGELIALLNNKAVDADRLWTFACKRPITEEAYHAYFAGNGWPDEPALPPKDHNQEKTGDPAVDLKAEYLAEKEIARDFLKRPVATQEDADRAAVWAKKVAGIVSSATSHFKAEKQPFLDGGKNVDERYRWRDDATSLVKALKSSQESFLREQQRLELERQRKAQAEAERIRREADAAQRKAEEAARAADLEAEKSTGTISMFADEAKRLADQEAAQQEAKRLAEAAAEADREAKARVVQAGRTGARVSLRTVYEANITDYDALLLALKDEPEIRDAVSRIANRIARSKDAAVPVGMERVSDQRAA